MGLNSDNVLHWIEEWPLGFLAPLEYIHIYVYICMYYIMLYIYICEV